MNAQTPNINLSIAAQYIKDLSFENKNFTQFLSNPPKSPQTALDFDVVTKDLGSNKHEVTLNIRATVKESEQTIYLLELSYAGAFLLQCSDTNLAHNVLMLECPRILFPAARTIITHITQDSGFPPLVLTPAIDFAALQHQKKKETAH